MAVMMATTITMAPTIPATMKGTTDDDDDDDDDDGDDDKVGGSVDMSIITTTTSSLHSPGDNLVSALTF